MIVFRVPVWPLAEERIPEVLAAGGIRVNDFARAYFAHPKFFDGLETDEIQIRIVSLGELGFADGAGFFELLQRMPLQGMKPCNPWAGLFFRLVWKDQGKSANNVLSGQHMAPDGAVTVFSVPLEEDDAFPKGLYLRNVDGELWLRGYRCDAAYRFSPDDCFAFEV